MNETQVAGEKFARSIAIVGGLLLLSSAIMVTLSVILSTFFRSNVKGDFELAQIANAVAIFAFLPLTQVKSGHVFVDTFTGWLPSRLVKTIDAFWVLVMGVVMAFISIRTLVGAMDAQKSNMQTMVLTIPQYPFIYICAFLSLMTAVFAFILALRILGAKS
jgi:TRAP-type C4-dicarboxylate transport system permease small subunit